jgi:hypothetical protein
MPQSPVFSHLFADAFALLALGRSCLWLWLQFASTRTSIALLRAQRNAIKACGPP